MMITRVGANINTQRQNRKNNQNFGDRYNEKQINVLATGSCGIGNKLIVGTEAGVFTRAENEDIISRLLQKHDNPILNTVAEILGIQRK